MIEIKVEEPAPDIEPDDNLGFLTHDTARAFTLAWAAVMAPLGLTRPQVRVLVWVEHIPGITQAELAERLTMSPMALTGLLDRMESKDLVKRVGDPKDRRVKRIYRTDGALKLKPDMDKIAAEFRKQLRQDIAAEDIATAVKVFRTLNANLQRIKDEAQN
jgi:DNA-binding MarR family transcriptional regulator